jgi:hypothetical protein
MREQNFVSEFMADFKKQGIFIRKIPDFPVSYVEDSKGKKRPRFLPTKPFDMFGHFPGGQAFYIEAKMKQKLGAFPLSSIRPIQLEELIAASKTRAVGFFAINYRIVIPRDDGGKVERQVLKYGLSDFVQARRLNLLTIMMPYDIIACAKSGKKSIPMDELFDDEAKGFVSRSRGGRWELEKIILAVHGRMARKG